MKILSYKSKSEEPAIIRLIAGSLRKGGVAVLPTDTIYGLSCLADDSRAIERIHSLKRRAARKPLIILVSSLAMLKKYVFLSKEQAVRLKKIWGPGTRPTTVIFRHRHLLAPELTAFSDSLAVRLPKSELLIKIVKASQKPLVSTSLNLSGEESIHDLARLSEIFPDSARRPDLVLDTGPSRRRKASRLIDLRRADKPVILRR
jgi:L-threonylcarbamoyladenylate synthase